MKSNKLLKKSVVTGIMRIAKESLFSGVNNLEIYSLLSHYYSSAFGFTEAEVERLAQEAEQEDRLPDIKKWYNGYTIGDDVIYNPWSVIETLTRPQDGCRPYWVNTSSDEMLRDLFLRDGVAIHTDIAKLLSGERVDYPVEEDLVLRELKQRPGAIWSLLLFSGYLTAEGPLYLKQNRHVFGLRIPNREVMGLYESIFSTWLEESLGGSEDVTQLGNAILSGNVAIFEELLQRYLEVNMSYYDFGGRFPERIYQAFIVGLLVSMEPHYRVRSNPESGFGRADVLITPNEPGKPGAVLELKSYNQRRDASVEQALDAAMKQIKDRDYAAQVLAAGACQVHHFACVFKGKEVWVKGDKL